ncbi:hypothetical protein G5I_08992 [Acromyrmex echinatior]|uniref:Uncharacterized protein n=1 Tax=Acromyrmex echinatior TaxID=103372 RepID=F4WT18_ACREC|nr:hypothetical protein G5I_08992 [Acromyrmex echinatior]
MRKWILDIPKTIIRNENQTEGSWSSGGMSNDEESGLFQKKTRHIVENSPSVLTYLIVIAINGLVKTSVTTRNTKSTMKNLNEDNRKKGEISVARDRVGEIFGKFKRVRGEENEQSVQEGTWKNERTRAHTVIALVMPDAEEKSGVEWSGVEWSRVEWSGVERSGASDNESRDQPDACSREANNASGRLRYRERNKFSCKANVDYPTVNVRGNYISQEEADCYRSYLRPSTTGSLGTSLGLARHKLHGQAGATARI